MRGDVLSLLPGQFSGLRGMLDIQQNSLCVLDGPLEQETALWSVEVTSDTRDADEIAFRLFRLRSYPLSPRLADVGNTVPHHTDPGAGYKRLNPVTRDKVILKQITVRWNEMLRLIGSWPSGAVEVSGALHVPQMP